MFINGAKFRSAVTSWEISFSARWMWEIPIPEISRSVFVVPPEAFKRKRAHVVILNDAAWSIVQSQRGKQPSGCFLTEGMRYGR